MMRAWVSKRLDFSFADWVFALGASLVPGRADAAARVEARWAPGGGGMAGLSVRSLFDLYLQAAAWEPGDRVIFTAFTVGDMPRIAREHGLEVVSVDLDPRDATPDVEALRTLMTPRTRAVVFTHLFGARLDVGEALAVAKEHGACFIEDCAEAYAGPDWTGHPEADLTLFSFGPIKTGTALGGGLARVGDAKRMARMRELAAAQPVQPAGEYLVRCLKYGLLAAATTPLAFGVLVRILAVVGPGHDALLHRLTRGFAGPEFFRRIRRRPSTPLLRVLERRLSQGDAPYRRRVRPAQRLLAGLQGLDVPTAHVRPHAYWLVPVAVPDAGALVARLDEEGFNATRGRAFAVVESDPGAHLGGHPRADRSGHPSADPGTDPGAGTDRLPGARRFLEALVFLPFSPEMPEPVLDRMADVVRAEAERQRREGASPPPGVGPTPAPPARPA